MTPISRGFGERRATTSIRRGSRPVVVNAGGATIRSQHAGTAILRSRRDAQILAAFAAAVRELREERELSQRHLTALSGLPVRRLHLARKRRVMHPAAP
jgi:hypothetical protein